jgi:mRNA interferase MazF
VLIRRGDIVLVDFDPAMHEAAKQRPAVVVTNNIANDVAPVIVVVPLTTNLERLYPHEIVLPVNRTGLEHDGKAQVHLIRHVSARRVSDVLGHVPDDLMIDLDAQLREHLAL